MSNNDDVYWWPEGYDLPPFRVQRRPYSAMEGGDYVRGSSVETLPHTALRTQSRILDDIDVTARAVLFARPWDYETIQLLWSWPLQLAPNWYEVALIRSAFGCPSNPRDGEQVFRALRTEFDHDRQGNSLEVLLPPPIVYDRFPPTEIVDSQGNRKPGIVPNGHWYYYTLFFRINTIDWIIGMQEEVLLPRDFRHREHMWNVVPPYYQWVDDNITVDAGYLRKFLDVFGFEQDYTREFVESYLNLYWIDRTPMSLLHGVGHNFGTPYEAGIGDIRYRALVAYGPRSAGTRGTPRGLLGLVESVSKYECDITSSRNRLMEPDDSDFYLSIGSWGSSVWAMGPVNDPDHLTIYYTNEPFTAAPPPAGIGRGSMAVLTNKAKETAGFTISCGDSVQRELTPPTANDALPGVPAGAPYHNYTPAESALPVQEGTSYGFGVYIRTEVGNVTVEPGILWYDGKMNQIDMVQADPVSADTNWALFKVAGLARGTIPGTSAYYTPENGNGTLQSPSSSAFNITGDYVIQFRASFVVNGATQRIMSRGQPEIRLTGTGELTATFGNAIDIQVLTAEEVAALGTDLVSLAVRLRVNEDGDAELAVLRYDESFRIWRSYGTQVVSPTWVAANPTNPMFIGNRNGGGSAWYGKIRWVQGRTGLQPDAGTRMWYVDMDDWSAGTSFNSGGRTWTLTSATALHAKVAGTAGARFMIPFVEFSGRAAGALTNRSPHIYLAGASTYILSQAGQAPAALVPPDRYLTMGDLNEKLGESAASGGGFVMGDPREA